MATALDRPEGLSRPVPAVVFFVAVAASMSGLSYAMSELPLGTAYAVWVGIGAALTVIHAMTSGQETVSVGKLVFLLMILGGVVGLNRAG